MSDNEDVRPLPPLETGKSEAELLMEDKKKRDKDRMDAEIEEYKEQREEEIVKMNADISELTEKIARRKVERTEDDRRLAEMAIVEQHRRKAEEDERQKKKKEAEESKREERQKAVEEAENRASQAGKRSFVITRKNKEGEDPGENDSFPVEAQDRKEESVKSKEQLEAEKRAILEQRIVPIGDIDSLDEAGVKEKAKELHTILYRLECDKYDLEQHFKQRQYEMMELADRARQMNKGKKKFNVTQESPGMDNPDPMGEKYSGIPPKISLCSKYERHKDRRTYVERKDVFGGPIYAEETPRILPGAGEGAQPEKAADEEED